jgi:hypothetical protein
MPRLRFRLSNLVMLLIIVGLVMALVTRWQRELDLRLHLKYLTEKNARSQSALQESQRALRDLQMVREVEDARLQARVAGLTALDESTLPGQTVDDGGIGAPAN